MKLVKKIEISASPEKVWEYLTQKGKHGQWFVELKDDLAPDCSYVMSHGGDVPMSGKVLEFDPPRRLVYTFNHKYLNYDTRVIFDLKSVETGTQLTLTHDGFEGTKSPEKMRDDHSEGWDEYLDNLKKLF